MEIVYLNPNKIRPDKHQPRQTIDHDKVEGMAQSILTEGIINPIEIDENFVIITGEMRWRAAKVAGLETIPCKIIKISEALRFRRQVIENIHHNTMTDWDTAKALQKMLAVALGNEPQHKGGYLPDVGISKVARMIGKSKRYVTDHLDILASSKPIQQAIKDNKIPYTFLRPIRRIAPEYKERMEQKILAGDFKTRDDALETVHALTRNPEKAEEIFNVKSIDELFKISPRAHEIVRARLMPSTEFIRIQNELLDWIKHNKPDSIVQKDRFLVLLGMSTIVDKLNAWGRIANEAQLEGKK